MPKKLPYTKDDFHRMLEQKLRMGSQGGGGSSSIQDALKIAAEKIKARLGGTAMP